MQTLLPPSIRQPLVECGPFVVVDGTFPGATIECQVAGTTVHQAAVSDVTPIWLIQIKLVPNAVVRVRQRLEGGEWSNWSFSTRVQPAVKSGPPVVLADHVLRGASTLRVVGLVPGSSVTVRAAPNGSLLGSAFAFPDGTAGVHLSNWVQKASKLVIDVSTCSEEGVKSDVPVSAPPRALPAPLIDGAVRCATRITVSGMIAGAILKIALSDGEMTHFPTEPRKRYRLPRPLVAGEQLTCWMEWSNGLKGAKTQVAVAKVLGAAHTIALEQPLFAGATQLKLGQWEFDELILVNAFGGLASSTPTETLGVGLPSPDGVLSLPRPLVAGEFIELSSSICLRRGISERFEVKPKPAKIASPRIAEPVLDGAFAVFVFGCEPDSTVVVSVEGAIAGSSTAGSDGYATVPVSPSLGVGSRVAAQCQFGNLSSLPGPRVRVRPLARLATPVIPAPTYDTERSLLIVGVAPGAWLTVWDAQGRPFREVRAAETAVRIAVPLLGMTTLSCTAVLGAQRKHSQLVQTIPDPGLEIDASDVKVGIFHLPNPASVPLPDDVTFSGGEGGYDFSLGLAGELPGEYVWRFFVEGRYYTVPNAGGPAKPVCLIVHGDDAGHDVVFSLNPVMIDEEEPWGNRVSDLLEVLGLSDIDQLGRVANATHDGIATACLGYDSIGLRLAKLGCVVLSLNVTGATLGALSATTGSPSHVYCSGLFERTVYASLRALKSSGLWAAGIPGTTADFTRTVLIGHSCGGFGVSSLPFQELEGIGISCVGVVGLEPALRKPGEETKEVPCPVLNISSLGLGDQTGETPWPGQVIGGPEYGTAVVQVPSGRHVSFNDYYSYFGRGRLPWSGDRDLEFQRVSSCIISIFVRDVILSSSDMKSLLRDDLPASIRDSVESVWIQPGEGTSLAIGPLDALAPTATASTDAVPSSIGADFKSITRPHFFEGPDQALVAEFTSDTARLAFEIPWWVAGVPGSWFVSVGGAYSTTCSRSGTPVVVEFSSEKHRWHVRLSNRPRAVHAADGWPQRVVFASYSVDASQLTAIRESVGFSAEDDNSSFITFLFHQRDSWCKIVELGPLVLSAKAE